MSNRYISFPSLTANGPVTSINSLTGDITLAAGTNVTIDEAGNILTINASGGGGSPGGSDTQVQFNDSGVFGGDSSLTFVKGTGVLSVGQLSINSYLIHTASNSGLTVKTDDGGSTSRDLTLQTGNAAGSTGTINIESGTSSDTGTTGSVNISTGDGALYNASSGSINLDVGAKNGSGTRGDINLNAPLVTAGGDLLLSHNLSFSLFGYNDSVPGYGIDSTVANTHSAFIIGQNDIPVGNSTAPYSNMFITTAARNEPTDPTQTSNMYLTIGDTYGTGGVGDLYIAGGKSYGVGGPTGNIFIVGNVNDYTAVPITVEGKSIALGGTTLVTGAVTVGKPMALKATPQTLTAGGSISSSTSFIQLQAAAPLSTSTSTVITAGLADGQTLQLVNIGANAITLKSGGNTDLPGATDYVLTASSSIAFIWSGSTWYTTSASVN